MTELNADNLYTTAETRAFLRIGNTKLYELIGGGLLPARKLGSSTRVLGADIIKYRDGLPSASTRKLEAA